jgi:hypothetical protein
VFIIEKLGIERHPSQVSKLLLDALRVLSRVVKGGIGRSWSIGILDRADIASLLTDAKVVLEFTDV